MRQHAKRACDTVELSHMLGFDSIPVILYPVEHPQANLTFGILSIHTLLTLDTFQYLSRGCRGRDLQASQTSGVDQISPIQVLLLRTHVPPYDHV